MPARQQNRAPVKKETGNMTSPASSHGVINRMLVRSEGIICSPQSGRGFAKARKSFMRSGYEISGLVNAVVGDLLDRPG
jgi:hypothetical protein